MGGNSVWAEDEMRELCGFPCSPSKLVELKWKFDSEINSKRTLDRIHDIKELLAVLRKRDALTPQYLDGIAEIIGFNKRSAGASYSYAINRYQQANASNRNEGLTRAYAEINEQLGSHWIDFARSLDLSECKIDQLYKCNDGGRRVKDILDHHESYCDPHVWRQKLLSALDDARRTDLRVKVADILDRFAIIDFRNCYT